MISGGRIWLVIGGFIGALVVLLGWLVGASPLFGQADLADAQRAEVDAVNAAQEAKIVEMRALNDRKEELLEELEELETQVPAAVDIADYLDWLATAANSSAVSLMTASAEAPALFDTSKGLGVVQFSPALSQSLYLIPIKMSLGGDAGQIRSFLGMLQSDGRLQLINSVQMRLGTTLTTEVSGYMFVIHDPASGPLRASTGGSSVQAPTPSDTSPDDGSVEPEPIDSPEPTDSETPVARGR